VLLQGDHPGGVQAGRTVTADDDRLTRAIGRFPAGVAFALAGAVYAGIGLALPLATGASTALLIVLNVMGAAFALALTLAWLYPLVESRVRRHLLEWTTDLRRLEPDEFEWLVGELLRREGWDVEETGRQGAPDGNVDLRAHRGGRTVLVQCKRWNARLVGVDEVRKLAGTLMREGLPGDAGTLVTLSKFTDDAVAEAGKVGVTLVDKAELVRRIEQVREAEPCPKCGARMVLDRSPRGWWYRCPRFREGCDGKRGLDRDPGRVLELLRAAGR
jgi:HJR/Mrr/RecB family endonuclease